MRLVALLLLLASTAVANAPNTSLRPAVRDGGASTIAAPVATPAADGVAPTPQVAPVENSRRPFFRTKRAEKRAKESRRALRRGAVCGDIAIQGEVVGRVPGRIKGCGIAEAVRVKSVSGVALTQHSVMDCETAQALKTWVDQSAKPALRRKGGGLARLRVAAHYACRTRNNQKGARISEHGKGRAIDISGFYLANDRLITVLEGWGASSTSGALRKMHKGACGPFGTVLGPRADRFHRDHFHFDTARYRGGPYCK
ncbi:extensin family protein [Aliishimia ponticola]|uniref:Extensin family protein n=1 Tax=Aliishimia ponticola TaxID=2499833 RepID=A0A4S4NC22_9RHOB|nr:extensin family protein [Aliishimia ponticola]THH36966.1 extensin family protein [Aliishimia ponticola]